MMVGLISAHTAALPFQAWRVERDGISAIVLPTMHALPEVTESNGAAKYKQGLDKLLKRSKMLYFERLPQSNVCVSPESRQRCIDFWKSYISAQKSRVSSMASKAPKQGTESELIRLNVGHDLEIFGLERPDILPEAFMQMRDADKKTTMEELKKSGPDYEYALQSTFSGLIRGDNLNICCSVTELAKARPSYYKKVVVERNALWAARISAKLRDFDGALIAVGAAHLCGNQSLIAELSRAGFAVAREDF